MILSAKFYASIGTAFEGQSSPSAPVADHLMILTSLVLLAPAKYALSAGRPWHAALFTTMAMVCTAYHVCDAKSSTLLLPGTHCPAPLPHILTLADHGCAYFCFVQMGFLLLGPEDHNLQWPHDATNLIKPWARVPASVLVHCRVLPLLGLLSFLVFYPDWHKFHYQMVLICVGMVLNGVGQFWISQTQREHAPKVIFHAVYWRRLGSLGLLPLSLCVVLFVFMENLKFGSGVAHAAWHVLVALLAMNVQRTIYHSCPDPVHHVLSYFLHQDSSVADVHSTSSKNPLVAQCLLGCIAITTLFTLVSGSVAHLLFPYNTHDWPVFGLDLPQWQCGYVVAVGTLLTLLAAAATFSLIGTVQMNSGNIHKRFSGQSQWRQRGCSLGHFSAFLGFVTFVASANLAPLQLRALALAATVCAVAGSVSLVTLSEAAPTGFDKSSVSLRRAIAVSINILSAGFMSSLYVLLRSGALQYTATNALQHMLFPSAWRTLAFSQYLLMGLLAVWPLTYARQVHDRWAGPETQLNSKMAKWPYLVAGIEF